MTKGTKETYISKNDAPCPDVLVINRVQILCDGVKAHQNSHGGSLVDDNGRRIRVLWRLKRNGED